MTEHRILGNICIKCDEPFTPGHPRAVGARGIMGVGSAMGLNVAGGHLEVGPVHEDAARCQAAATMRKASRAANAKAPCDVFGKKHQWRERDERCSPWSTQSVGKYWVCVLCGARSEEKPTAWTGP